MNHFTPRRAFLGFALFLLVCGSIRIAPPDLAFYYSFARSLLYDADFCFANEYPHFEFGYHETYATPLHLPANDWPIGTGLCWLPFLFVSGALQWFGTAIGICTAPDGFSWFDKWFVTLGSTLLFGGGTVWLSYLLCRQYGFSKSTSLWAVMAIAAGSTFTYHLYVNSADSHTPSAFFTALFLYQWNERKVRRNTVDALVLGSIAGLAGLVRPHNATILLIPCLEILFDRNRGSTTLSLRFIFALFCASIVTYIPQLIVWKTLYGSWFALPRAGEVFWSRPHLFEMLFSDFHGMISWSPLFGLGLIGLFTLRTLWIPAIPVLLQIYIYSCNMAWWAGGSFGNRRMVGCTALFCLGLAALLKLTGKAWVKILIVVCAVWTYLLLLAEVGGAIQLGHFMSWKMLVSAIPSGMWPGIVHHFTIPAWGEHSLERIFGFLCITGLGAAFLHWRLDRALTSVKIITTVTIAFLILCSVAGLRSANNAKQYDLSDYHPNDRFTWVVYYEESFYLLHNGKADQAMEDFLAASVAEPRHPQSWTYAAWTLKSYGSDLMAYHYARQAFSYGQRMKEFLAFFDRVITSVITRGDLPREVLFNERGIVRTIQGDYDLARYDFQSALKVDKTYAFAIANLQILESWVQGNPQRLEWE